MAQTELTLIPYWRFARDTVAEKLSLHLLLALFTLISITTLTTILFVRLKFMEPDLLSDPSLAYTFVFPGQPHRAALEHGFSCFDARPPSLANLVEECVYHPQTGPFYHVKLTVWDGGIRRLDFTVRENALTLGDLSLLWGRVEVDERGPIVIMKWPGQGVTATAQSQGGRYTYFLPVSQVSFVLVAEGQPDALLHP